MRRRRTIVGLAVLALAAVVVAVTFWPHGPRPCRATFEQVREGMTYDEVCATVGGPPGNYANGPFGAAGRSYWYGRRWVCDDCLLVVSFGADEIATFVTVIPHLAPARPPSLLDRIRTRLGL